MPDTPPRPTDGLADQLDRIEATAAKAAKDAAAAYREAKSTNGRVDRIEDTLHGSTEERKRQGDPGLVAKVNEVRQIAFDLRTARDESEAVKDVKRWLIGIGLTVLTTMLGALGVLVQLARTMG